MSGGLTNYAASAIMEGTAIPLSLYLKFHIGDPGADGLLFPAVHTTRQLLTFVPGDLDFKYWNSNTATWSGISFTETATHLSLWDAASAGNPWFVGVFDPVMALVNAGSAVLAPHRVLIFTTPYEP